MIIFHVRYLHSAPLPSFTDLAFDECDPACQCCSDIQPGRAMGRTKMVQTSSDRLRHHDKHCLAVPELHWKAVGQEITF